jgi:phospho-N-acetylmuramoyl-pentapeptide-transferase
VLLWALELLRWLTDGGDLGPLRVFQYISVRAAAALLTAFGVSLAVGPWTIDRIRARGGGEVVRDSQGDGAISLREMHGGKQGTPTMGGLLIMISLLVATALFCRLGEMLVLLLLAVSLAFGALGFWDDYLKVIRKKRGGLSARSKLAMQCVLGFGLGLALWAADWPIRYSVTGDGGYDHLLLPFFKTAYPSLGFGFVLWVVLVMTATANAANLTDGLDGLAIGVTLCVAAALTIVAYLASRFDYAGYLFIPHVPGAGEVVVFGGALIGASMGFLWFNSHPAQIFMGDTGSMMLGGALGAMALAIKQELMLIVVGGVFVAEAASVMVQVGGFKMTGRRIFRMAPLHHHYEKMGIHESKIIIRFWSIAVLLALLGLATLKLR